MNKFNGFRKRHVFSLKIQKLSKEHYNCEPILLNRRDVYFCVCSFCKGRETDSIHTVEWRGVNIACHPEGRSVNQSLHQLQHIRRGWCLSIRACTICSIDAKGSDRQSESPQGYLSSIRACNGCSIDDTLSVRETKSAPAAV